MNNTQIVSKKIIAAGNLFSDKQIKTDYLWKNLIIEKRVSNKWFNKLYKASIFHAFWLVLSSPVK